MFKLAELAWKKKIFVICDEVYKDFIYSDTNLQMHPNLQIDSNNKGDISSHSEHSDKFAVSNRFFSLAQIPDLRKMVIRVFSMSKIYAMTGWRIGFVHSDEENISEIVKVHDALVTCAPTVSQYAAIAALDFADKEAKEFCRQYQERRDLICGYLDELPEVFSYQKPNSSYFVFPKIARTFMERTRTNTEKSQHKSVLGQRKSVSWDFATDLLNKAHVAVVPGIAFGPSGEGHIRLSFGRNEKDIHEAMKRIKNYFNE
ncbi:MAG: pyridoxal phosphate-dependent aminotransferase [Spirochaetia bacterium]|nr:MAG: pyridoxal phosphate-dependent aminotransferase [Spirochaetia bacterium]